MLMSGDHYSCKEETLRKILDDPGLGNLLSVPHSSQHLSVVCRYLRKRHDALQS